MKPARRAICCLTRCKSAFCNTGAAASSESKATAKARLSTATPKRTPYMGLQLRQLLGLSSIRAANTSKRPNHIRKANTNFVVGSKSQ